MRATWSLTIVAGRWDVMTKLPVTELLKGGIGRGGSAKKKAGRHMTGAPSWLTEAPTAGRLLLFLEEEPELRKGW